MTPEEWATEKEYELSEIKAEAFAALEKAGSLAAIELLKRLRRGKVEGSIYWSRLDKCGCWYGTLSIKAIDGFTKESHQGGCSDLETFFELNGYRDGALYTPLERFFYNVEEGDTTKTNSFSALAESWLVEWLMDEYRDLLREGENATPENLERREAISTTLGLEGDCDV